MSDGDGRPIPDRYDDCFGVRYILEFDGESYIDSEPMTADDWEAWLSND